MTPRADSPTPPFRLSTSSRPFVGLVALVLAGQPLGSQPPKAPAPRIVWSYETPQEFLLMEPGYRFPLQIKMALIQFVQPDPELSKAYLSVFMDKRRFAAWLKRVLIDQRNLRTRPGSPGKVLSSDLSEISPEGGTVLSTAKPPSTGEREREAIEGYLEVLKRWAPER